MSMRKLLMAAFSLVLLVIPVWRAGAGGSAQGEAKKDVVLEAADITAKIFPEKVFYRGQVGSVQMRNTGGVHFADGFYVLAGLVDTTGYASSLKEKYQGYLLTEVGTEINGQALKPGAYGIGFVAGSKFVVSDLGATTVLEVGGQKDAELKRPVPLQVVEGADGGGHRLYLGREFVTIKRAR
jgi:hypothetical protein